MDYIYLTPRDVRRLHDGVLASSLVECRQAAALLARNPTLGSAHLLHKLQQVVAILEGEQARRFAGAAAEERLKPAMIQDISSFSVDRRASA